MNCRRRACWAQRTKNVLVLLGVSIGVGVAVNLIVDNPPHQISNPMTYDKQRDGTWAPHIQRFEDEVAAKQNPLVQLRNWLCNSP